MNIRSLLILTALFVALVISGAAQASDNINGKERAENTTVDICKTAPSDCLCKTAPRDCENPFHIPQEWFACKIDDDCGRVYAGCDSVRTPAVNKEHIDDAKAIICKADRNLCPADCSKSSLPNAIPRCETGRCILEPLSNDIFILPPP